MRKKENEADMIIRPETMTGVRTAVLLDPRTESLVRKYMPSVGALADIADVLDALADPGRLRIVSALSVTEMCVSDLAGVLDVNQTTLSHQLRVLRAAGVVGCKKQGKVAFYSLACDSLGELMLIVSKLAATRRPLPDVDAE